MRSHNYLYLIFFIAFISCKTTQQTPSNKVAQANQVLFQVNEEPVFVDEFMYAYQKSAKNKGSLENIDEYLELYINFKLKVADAKKEGLDTLATYKNELAGYLQDIKKPYLTAEKINETLLTETYQRLQEEVKASHILIQLSPDASPSDTLTAYNKLVKIQNSFKEGVPFEELAKKYSEDPSAKQNQGNLGWFTAFQMVYPFESAAYTTAVGELSDIIRTRFGYHVVYVQDKRETSGKIKIAHIMLRFPAGGKAIDTVKVKSEIYKIHNQLIEGENWFTLAVKYSEDLNSKDSGGSLPWFGVGALPKSLEDAAFKLSQAGQISSPIKSPYGWHIIKLEEKRGMGSFENMRESISQRVQRDQRSELKTSEVIEKLKAENNFKRNEAVYVQLRSQESLLASEVPSSLLQKTLFSIKNENYLVEDFLQQNTKGKPFKEGMEAYEKKMLLDYENNHLGEKYPEYKMLSSEYEDGLLLFEIMNRKVWSKISTDTSGMKAFYLDNKEQYKSPLQVVADIFLLNDSLQIQELKSLYLDSLYEISDKLIIHKNGTADQVPSSIKTVKDSIYAQLYLPIGTDEEKIKLIKKNLKVVNTYIKFLKPNYSEENEIYLQFFQRSGKYLKEYYGSIKSMETGTFNAAKFLNNNDAIKAGSSKLTTADGQIHLINILEVISPIVLDYEKAKSELISDYQRFLENKWIEQLKKENKVIVNQSVLTKLKEEIEN